VDNRSPWDKAETVAGFTQSPANATLLAYAGGELRRLGGRGRVIDIGCGAGRNAVPLAAAGWDVFGIDLSEPMIVAAARRAHDEPIAGRLDVALAAMGAIPACSDSTDLVIAHGIWNLARSAAEFRSGVGEAARVSKPGAALFVFTFSRHTLPPQATPVAGEPFVFTDFSGDPQCFLTEDQLMAELAACGFRRDEGVAFREHNLPKPGTLQGPRAPVIYEAAFRYQP
jgi:SAM-dependent methyltransferase